MNPITLLREMQTTLSEVKTTLGQIQKEIRQMAVTQTQFDADQQVEAADVKALIGALGTFVTAYQSLAANPAVADLTSEDAQAKADDASIKQAIAGVQGILAPSPAATGVAAAKDAAPA